MQHGLHFINKICIPVAWASNFSGYATAGERLKQKDSDQGSDSM